MTRAASADDVTAPASARSPTATITQPRAAAAPTAATARPVAYDDAERDGDDHRAGDLDEDVLAEQGAELIAIG